MTAVRRLNPHDPLPDDLGRHVLVLHRFDEDEPRRTVVELSLVTAPGRVEATRPSRPDGKPMSFEEAVEAGKRVAASEGLDVVYAVDRTAGPREKSILTHGGDHSAPGEALDDTDMEEGERGPDMRDLRPSRSEA